MHTELKPIASVREGEQGQIATPFHALGQLKNARLGFCRIKGLEHWLETCTNQHEPWDWNYQERGWQRLHALVEAGELVLVHDKSRPPLRPAYREVNGHWEVTRDVWEPAARQQLQRHTQTLHRQRLEQERWADRAPAGNTATPVEESTTGPGNRPATLGPQAGLHNQDWAAVEVKRDSFKPVKQVDMDNLSAEDAMTAQAIRSQGWKGRKVEQVLKSGNNFTPKPLQPGDKLYGFGTEGRAKNIKGSAYWLDESGFKEVQAKYFRNGQWDKEGVKNHLALPCFNRATNITTVQVTQPTTAVESTVGKVRELIQYTDTSGYTTGMMGKIMGGGSKQITADPSVLAKL